MALYFFDIDEDGSHTHDTIGTEFHDLEEACNAAMTALTEIARDHHAVCEGTRLTAAIRDESGETLFIARLLLTSQTLR